MTSDDPIVFIVDDDHRVREALCSLIAETALPAADPAHFLAQAGRSAAEPNAVTRSPTEAIRLDRASRMR